jgi:hypothetical protein
MGGSPLVVGLQRGLCQLGHEVDGYDPRYGYDLVVIFNQCAHTTDYAYPEFPERDVPIAFVDSAEFGYFTRLPDRAHLYANTFTETALAHDTKNRSEQERLKAYLEGRSFPYFLREFSKHVQYPVGYHPIDYPLYRLSECHDRPNREEYLRRDLDLFMSWGASHPWRMPITDGLRGCHTKSEILVLQDQPGAPLVPRMPQAQYFGRTRAAKASVSFDGYGSGSFRMTEVLCRTLLLQGPLSIRTRAPLVDGQTCRTYKVETAGEEFVRTDVCCVLRDALEDVEGSYAIYERGFEHCYAHLTERATAQYLLDTVAAHDWRTPTPVDLASWRPYEDEE